MTNEEINRAIAEHLGWMAHPTCKNVWRTPEQAQRNKALIGTVNGPWSMESSGPPNYAGDLNSMHEAEKALFDADDGSHAGCLRYQYARYLYDVTVPKDVQPMTATALQRAEAFLRTIGKWNDNK